ncbi:cadherin-89D [Cimex lectularius]|uniref:Cadherin domain-containing protein n=1 Tax=Cimex lectularius TaxID=79782 RepID=A0A8I6SVF9_CIMLE|nr:cadherin-89D [Cimex lectularius]XP_024086217.1 cadherin-89D [Cimex lectularius]
MKGLIAWTVLLATFVFTKAEGCQFYPQGEYLRFVRVPESLEVGDEVLLVEVHPRRNLSIQAVDQKEDAHFFKFKAVNRTHISLRLAQSLENLVDNPVPQNVLKFRLVCDYQDGEDTINSYLSATVYVEDVNDHGPVFVDAPYHVNVDELTPTGLTVFRGIHAVDMDKPNTPNSELVYSLSGGNVGSKFSLEMQGQRPALVLKRSLDYDDGDKQYKLIVTASDRGSPPRSATTTVSISVNDSDDLNPTFTKDVYKTQITETYPMTGKKIHVPLLFAPRIKAYDQDLAINATVRYDIITGNDKHLFYLDPQNGTLFLEKEIDLDTLPGMLFTLQIQATQLDNPLKTGVARVEVEVLDLNDNQPQFEVEMYNISIVENLPNGFSVLQVIAADIDQGDNGEFVYHLVDPSQAFSIDSRTGWLTVRNQAKLDREVRPTLNMRVLAREKMPSLVSASSDSYVNIEVTLLDANDNNPTFVPSNLYEFTISNVAPIGFMVGKVEASDPDLGRNGMVLYELKRGNKTSHSVPFIVHPKSGAITIADSPIPMGRKALFVEASDQPANPSERRFSLAVVTIDVVVSDKMNIPPDFVGAPYEFWVGDDVPVGTSIGQVRVTEAIDKSRAIFDLLHSYHEGVPFAIEERSGTISVIDEISKYEHNKYDFEAVVTDDRSVSIVTNLTVHIVESQMSNMDKTSLLEFKVRENISGAMVGRIVVGPGKDSRNKPLKFSITDHEDSSMFAVSQDGTLYTQRSLDREYRDSYFLTVIVHNGRGDRYYQVHVTVEDENDNAPMFDRNWYEGHIREDCRVECEVRLDHIIRVTDPDKGPNSEFIVSLQGDGSEIFQLTRNGKIVLKAPLDRETKETYSLTLVAKDKGNLSSQIKLTIHVDDVNDNTPQFVQMLIPHEGTIKVIPGSKRALQIVLGNETIPYPKDNRKKKDFTTIILPETLKIGRVVFRILAVDKDLGDNATLKYVVDSETFIPKGPFTKVFNTHHFAIHPMNGEVTVAALLPPESEFLVNFTVNDGGGLKDWLVVRFNIEDVNDNPPVFDKARYDFTIQEGNYNKFLVGRVLAKDEDYGANGNISYTILQKRDNTTHLPFSITSQGDIHISGNLDREIKDRYSFKILSQDNGPLEKRQRATAEVVIHISDINDNAPIFYGFDRVLQTAPSEYSSIDFDPEQYEPAVMIPVYFASVVENSAPGVPIAKILANDSDLPDNGNGIILYDIPRKKNHRQLFAIDKEGVVTVTTFLDYEAQSSHNVTIIASDLGQPSMSSTALLIVTVVDVVENVEETVKTLVPVNYYELEVEENCAVPLELLKINVTNNDMDYKFSLIPTVDMSAFLINQKNGTLYLTVSPDREVVHILQAKIKVTLIKRAKNMAHVVYPIYPNDLNSNEVKVIVRVKDVNDNPPKFKTSGRPYVAAIPTTATYGYPIIRLHATDNDEGINGQVRYHMLTRDDSEPTKFAIDPISGQVRAIMNFEGESGKVYGFDVKATDRRGMDDGLSTIANVFVYVLDEQKKIVMVMGAKLLEIEHNIDNITGALSNVTGLDVRVRKLEPHDSKDATDMYLYAVDPLMNVILDSETFNQVLKAHPNEVKKAIEPYHMLSIMLPESDENYLKKNYSQSYINLSGLELATIALGCIVFLGAVTSVFCVICLHKRRFVRILKLEAKKKKDMFNVGITPLSADLMFHSKDHMDTKQRSMFHLNTFVEDSTDSYVSNRSDCQRYRRPQRRHRHLSTCPRHQSRRRVIEKAPSTTLLKNSLASVHSSGRDSGIVEPHHGCCPCGHSSTHSSANSSQGSYEDSLKSLHRQHSRSSGSPEACIGHQSATIGRRRSLRGNEIIRAYPPPVPPPISRRPSVDRSSWKYN